MTRAAQKAEEHVQLVEALRLLNIAVDGDPIDEETPDFVVRLADGTVVGIEVVRAIDEFIAGGRGARRRLNATTTRALQAAGINAWVTVTADDHTFALLNAQPRTLGDESTALVNIARSVMSSSPEKRWYWYEWIDQERDELYGRTDPDVLDLEGTGIVHAHRVGIHPWDEPLATWAETSNGQRANIVQEAIADKAEAIETYRARAKEKHNAAQMWLLVVGSTGTGGALVVEHVEGLTYTSPFDRTIFLETFEGCCIDLATQPPQPPQTATEVAAESTGAC